MKELFCHCLEDITRYAGECRQELLSTVAVICLFRTGQMLVQKKTGKDAEQGHPCSFLSGLMRDCAWSIYLIFVSYITLGMRQIGSRQELSILLWQAVLLYPEELPLFLENILLFLPYGGLFFLTFRSGGSIRRLLLSAAVCSLSIELLQLFLRCGKTELLDLLLNLAGAVLGWGFTRAAAVFWSGKSAGRLDI